MSWNRACMRRKKELVYDMCKSTFYWNSVAVICPQVRCACNCEHSGFKRDKNGCQTCLCNDPCEVNQQNVCSLVRLTSNCPLIFPSCYVPLLMRNRQYTLIRSDVNPGPWPCKSSPCPCFCPWGLGPFVPVLAGPILEKSLLEDLSPHDRSDVGNYSISEVQQPRLMDNDMLFLLALTLYTVYSRELQSFVVNVHCRCLIAIVGLAASPYRPLKVKCMSLWVRSVLVLSWFLHIQSLLTLLLIRCQCHRCEDDEKCVVKRPVCKQRHRVLPPVAVCVKSTSTFSILSKTFNRFLLQHHLSAN